MNQRRMQCCFCDSEAMAIATDFSNRDDYLCPQCGRYEISVLAARKLAESGNPSVVARILELIKTTPEGQLLSVTFDGSKQEFVFERGPMKRL